MVTKKVLEERLVEKEAVISSLEMTISALINENEEIRNHTVNDEIAMLRECNNELHTTLDLLVKHNTRTNKSGFYYMKIQDAIAEDEMLQDAWKSFIMTMKMRFPEIVPGLTVE